MKYKNNSNPLHHIPALLALLSMCAVTSGISMFFFNIPSASILWHSTGALFFTVFIRLKRASQSRPADYIQSGEAIFGSLALILILHLAGAGPLLSLIILAVLFISFEMYFHGFLRLKERELIYSGLFLAVLLFVFILFLKLFDASFAEPVILNLFMPYATVLQGNLYLLSALGLLGCAMYILLSLTAPELSLLALGRSYFEISGIGFSRARILPLIARGLAASGCFFILGWSAGGVFYIVKDRPGQSFTNDAVLMLLCVFYTQALLLCTRIISPYLIILLIFTFSWGMYLYRNKERILRYD